MSSSNGQHHSTNGSGGRDLIKTLENVRRFQDDFDIEPDRIRPCIADLFYEGVDHEREPHAMTLAVELHYLGLDDDQIEDALRRWSGRLVRPLKPSDVSKHRGRYDDGQHKPRKCSNAMLQAYCFGRDCHWKNQSKLVKKESSIMSSFFDLGWPMVLRDTQASLVYLSLHRIRILSGAGADQVFPTSYVRIERESGVPRSLILQRLMVLYEFGLLSFLEIGTPYGSGERRRTRLSIASPMPDPTDEGWMDE